MDPHAGRWCSFRCRWSIIWIIPQQEVKDLSSETCKSVNPWQNNQWWEATSFATTYPSIWREAAERRGGNIPMSEDWPTTRKIQNHHLQDQSLPTDKHHTLPAATKSLWTRRIQRNIAWQWRQKCQHILWSEASTTKHQKVSPLLEKEHPQDFFTQIEI